MRRSRRVFPALIIALGAMLACPGQARAQFGGGGFGNQAVGGISVDASGIVQNLAAGAVADLAAQRRQALGADAEGDAAGDLRKVSLRGIVSAVEEAVAKNVPLSPEVLFLGGLERVTHVFVDPEGHDVVLAGPADRITVDAAGNFVTATSRRPPLQLEDLVVALRAIDGARQGGMLCSIDPTPQGIQQLQAFLSRQRTIGRDPAVVFRGMEEALGPQTITVGGVPGDSRFARVLVAADYRMKRIGMGLDESGVEGLPSYLALVPAGGRAASLPRFWLEPEYDPISRDADELAWRIDGRRMKCLTESDVAGRGGAVQRGAAGQDAVAARWCEAMTKTYDALAAKQPVFAELVNCIDLAVVAALVKDRQLDDRAGLDLGVLLDPARLPLPKYDVPARVPTVATGVKKGTNWVLSASGGVQFQPWRFATNVRDAADLGPARGTALSARPASGWRWD